MGTNEGRELVDVKGDLQLSKNPEFLPLLLQKLQILGGFQFMSDFPSQAPLPPHLDHRAEVKCYGWCTLSFSQQGSA